MADLPSPFEKRLLDLQLLQAPETAEELAFLEEYVRWKANDGPAKFEAKRNAQWWHAWKAKRREWKRRREP
jgi:hypothetical protein